ncbi:MAG TPA: hypothetical protein PKK12_02510, partial [Candidatus Aminicenantes bacterium]|nr:hypothetical protein [Candidatus Aminicenantes bacterium]
PPTATEELRFEFSDPFSAHLAPTNPSHSFHAPAEPVAPEPSSPVVKEESQPAEPVMPAPPPPPPPPAAKPIPPHRKGTSVEQELDDLFSMARGKRK